MLSQRTLNRVCRDYYRAYRLHACPVDATGQPYCIPRGFKMPPGVGDHCEATVSCLQEALHWGEPYVFYRTSGIISWIVAMVNRLELAGGILGGEVLAQGCDPQEAVNELAVRGVNRTAARRHVARLQVMPAARIREAAWRLSELFYQISGWQPELLEENRGKARQQRQIAEAMDEHRRRGNAVYPLDRERDLLALIKAGDHNGARRMLNEVLGAMFLSSPSLVVLRARTIEMMGYLTRAAVEDNISMEPLLEENHHWMRKLIAAADFETLAHVLMKALDGFMDGIYRRGRPAGHPRLNRALDFIGEHYAETLSLPAAARACGLSAYRLSHLLKQHTGKTFLQHVNGLRVRRSVQMLEKTDLSCLEIAIAVGFCDQSYFTRQFRRRMGITPGRYRRHARTGHGAAN